jgi:23S rRNA pseudouridine2457 synthase
LNKHSYYIIYKPFNVLSQFSNDGDKKTLKDFFNVEKDVYPIGRLDYDSEGLLILTMTKSLNQI